MFRNKSLFHFHRKSNGGFTILELMVMVAIVGVLAKISVSSYNSNQAKSRQSEAKIALATIYNLEKSFYSEYSAYIADFDALGYTPAGPKRLYAIGWTTCTPAGRITGYNSPVGNCWYSRQGHPTPWVNTFFTTFAQTYFNSVDSTKTNPQTFFIWAGGQIQSDATGSKVDGDWWSMDSLRMLVNGCTTLNCYNAAGLEIPAGWCDPTPGVCCAVGSTCTGY